MFSMLLMLDPVAETLVLPSKCHLVTQRWTQGGPLCPQEVLKRLGRTSELVAQRRERGFLQNARGPDSHKELPSRQVAVWLEPTPRVWKGAVLVIASASQSRQKYIKGFYDDTLRSAYDRWTTQDIVNPGSIFLKPDSI